MSYQRLHTTEIYLGSQQHFRSLYLLCQASNNLTSFSMTTSFFSSHISHQIFCPQMLIHSSSLWSLLWEGIDNFSHGYPSLWWCLIQWSLNFVGKYSKCIPLNELFILVRFSFFFLLRKDTLEGSQNGVSRALLWGSLGFLKTGLVFYFFLRPSLHQKKLAPTTCHLFFIFHLL